MTPKSVNFAFVSGLIFFLIINYSFFTFFFSFKNILIFIISNFIFLIIHEGLHFLGYMIGGAKKDKIKLGIKLKQGVTYAVCQDELNKKSAIRALLMPFFILGLPIYIIGIINDNYLLTLLAIFTIIGSIGDIIIALFLSKLPADIKYQETKNPLEFLIISNDNKIYRSFGIVFNKIKN